MSLRIALLLVISFAAQTVLAHHSFAPYFDSDKPISITGTVVEFEARNPHAYLHIQAIGADGQANEYVCESHGATQLARNGIAKEMRAVGTVLRVEGVQGRYDPYLCFFRIVELQDGRILSVDGDADRRRASAQAAAAASGRADIFGKWLLVPFNRSTSGPNPMIQYYTEAGEAALARYDPYTDDPTFRCDPVAVRRVWGAPGTPLAISREADRVILRHEWMDVERTVYLGLDEHPTDAARISLGHSIGRFDGDTLIIETGHYADGVLRQYVQEPGGPMKALLHSDALTTTETLSFDRDSQRLTVTIEHDDPKFFTRTFPSVTMQYAPTNLDIEPFGCIAEVED